jgi:hypothetical protein
VFPALVVPKLEGALGANGKEFDKVEYVVPPVTGLLSKLLEIPPIGGERGVPYESK